jgi:hypothetical protein
MRGRGGWRGREVEAVPAAVGGLTLVSSRWREAWRGGRDAQDGAWGVAGAQGDAI